MAISTHKMLADAGKVNTARIAPKDSYGVSAKHFFNCTETASPISDVIGGLTLDDVPATNTIGAGDDSGVNTRILAYSGTANIPALTSGTWNQPAGNDVVLVVAAKARINGAGDPHEGGFTSFYVGDSDNGQFRVQPYYAVFQIGSDKFATPFYNSSRIRTDGVVYIYAAVKRGSTLEHYTDGVLTGSRDYSEQTSALKTEWDNWTPDAVFKCGHSAYCEDIVRCYNITCVDADVFGGSCGASPNMTQYINLLSARLTCDHSTTANYLAPDGTREVVGSFANIAGNSASTSEYADDYYGFYMGVFNSAPSQQSIIDGINYMKTEWTAGNKAIYPGWVAYA